MKGPAIAESDNLNPWHWKKERAPRSKNTAPAVKETINTFEKADCNETEYVMVPASAADKLKGYVPIDRLTAQKIIEQAPLIKGTLNTQERRTATESKGSLKPLMHVADLLAPQASPCAENAGQALAPTAAPDKLEGYEPQFFLKEDGKDYE